jgi:hypothetical protein
MFVLKDFFCLFVNVQDIHKPQNTFQFFFIMIHFCNLNERLVNDFIFSLTFNPIFCKFVFQNFTLKPIFL